MRGQGTERCASIARAIRLKDLSLSLLNQTLERLRVIPEWASKALAVKQRSLDQALKAKDPLAVKDAQRGIARIRSKVGLEGHADDRKRV